MTSSASRSRLFGSGLVGRPAPVAVTHACSVQGYGVMSELALDRDDWLSASPALFHDSSVKTVCAGFLKAPMISFGSLSIRARQIGLAIANHLFPVGSDIDDPQSTLGLTPRQMVESR